MTPSPEPTDWEAQALLPARLLAGSPPAMRQKLQRAGRSLYLLILEGLGTEPAAPHLAHEVNALVGELFLILRALHGICGIDGLEPVAETLDEALQETVTHLESLGKLTVEQTARSEEVAAETMGLRPFALSLSREAHYQEAIQALGECMATLRGEPSRAEWLMALHQDLLWVHTVLQRHIASRGEVSSLGPGESRLCSVAGILAGRLQRPLELLQGVIERAAASEAIP